MIFQGKTKHEDKSLPGTRACEHQALCRDNPTTIQENGLWRVELEVGAGLLWGCE